LTQSELKRFNGLILGKRTSLIELIFYTLVAYQRCEALNHLQEEFVISNSVELLLIVKDDDSQLFVRERPAANWK